MSSLDKSVDSLETSRCSETTSNGKNRYSYFQSKRTPVNSCIAFLPNGIFEVDSRVFYERGKEDNRTCR